jgi:hypothetical protein
MLGLIETDLSGNAATLPGKLITVGTTDDLTFAVCKRAWCSASSSVAGAADSIFESVDVVVIGGGEHPFRKTVAHAQTDIVLL